MPACEKFLFFGRDPADGFDGRKIPQHDGKGLARSVLTCAKFFYGIIVIGGTGQMKAANALDGHNGT